MMTLNKKPTSTDVEKQIPRKGVSNKLTEAGLMSQLNLPQGYCIGTAVDNGGCGFDSIAQCLNEMDPQKKIYDLISKLFLTEEDQIFCNKSEKIYDEKFIRLICVGYYSRSKDNKDSVDTWVKKLGHFDPNIGMDCYSDVKYTSQELGVFNFSKHPARFRQGVEGRILCDVFSQIENSFEGIHIIEAITDRECQSIGHYLITKQSFSLIEEEEEIEGLYKKYLTLLIAGSHFVPILPKPNVNVDLNHPINPEVFEKEVKDFNTLEQFEKNLMEGKEIFFLSKWSFKVVCNEEVGSQKAFKMMNIILRVIDFLGYRNFSKEEGTIYLGGNWVNNEGALDLIRRLKQNYFEKITITFQNKTITSEMKETLMEMCDKFFTIHFKDNDIAFEQPQIFDEALKYGEDESNKNDNLSKEIILENQNPWVLQNEFNNEEIRKSEREKQAEYSLPEKKSNPVDMDEDKQFALALQESLKDMDEDKQFALALQESLKDQESTKKKPESLEFQYKKEVPESQRLLEGIFEALPTGVLQEVAFFLKKFEDRIAFMSTNKNVKLAVEKAVFWKKEHNHDFPEYSSQHLDKRMKNWYDMYRNSYLLKKAERLIIDIIQTNNSGYKAGQSKKLNRIIKALSVNSNIHYKDKFFNILRKNLDSAGPIKLWKKIANRDFYNFFLIEIFLLVLLEEEKLALDLEKIFSFLRLRSKDIAGFLCSTDNNISRETNQEIPAPAVLDCALILFAARINLTAPWIADCSLKNLSLKQLKCALLEINSMIDKAMTTQKLEASSEYIRSHVGMAMNVIDKISEVAAKVYNEKGQENEGNERKQMFFDGSKKTFNSSFPTEEVSVLVIAQQVKEKLNGILSETTLPESKKLKM